MILKMRYLVIISLLIMPFSWVGSGADNPISLITEQFASKNYIPDSVNQEKPNLFIGGILQENSNADYASEKWKNFADQNDAIYVPTYYTHNIPTDVLAVNDAAKSKKTDVNGLTREELNGKSYGTIIGYSGGTTTVVTAMAEQSVRADTLILISPMMGGSVMPGETFNWKGEFEKKLKKILSQGTKIIVIQSSDDKPSFGSEYQYKIPMSRLAMSSNWLSDIEVHNVKLEKSGNDGHKDIFDTYAMQNIKKGVYVDPTAKQTLKFNSVTSLMSWDSLQEISKSNSLNFIGGGWNQPKAIPVVYGNYPAGSVPSSTPTPQGIQEAVDNMLPAGEYNHYEDTIPVFHQARL